MTQVLQEYSKLLHEFGELELQAVNAVIRMEALNLSRTVEEAERTKYIFNLVQHLQTIPKDSAEDIRNKVTLTREVCEELKKVIDSYTTRINQLTNNNDNLFISPKVH